MQRGEGQGLGAEDRVSEKGVSVQGKSAATRQVRRKRETIYFQFSACEAGGFALHWSVLWTLGPSGKAAVAAPCGVARLGQATSLPGGVHLACHRNAKLCKSRLRTHPKVHNTL